MKHIPVTLRGHTVWADVDDEDYAFLLKHKWTLNPSSRTSYAKTNIETTAGFKSVAMHRMVIGDAQETWQTELTGFVEHRLENGKTVFILPDGKVRKMTVDHIDGNGLNNRRANLRHLSCREQTKNRRLH
jgi:hypothetical protein